MPAKSAYSRLPLSPSHDDCLEPLVVEDVDEGLHNQPKPRHLSEAFCWKLFIAACILSLAISAANLTALSAWTTAQLPSAREQLSELKKPSPYLGLENVVFDPPYCRSRATYPKTVYTYDARHAPNAALTRVNAPGEEAGILTFGGPIRAIADIYVPDYGLENCTLHLRRIGGAETPQPAVDVDAYLRPSANPADGQSAMTFLDTLTFAPGKESISRPFHCPSRSSVFVEWRCPAAGCQLSISLEGVTSMTSSHTSLSKSGFRVTQYEALSCIDV